MELTEQIAVMENRVKRLRELWGQLSSSARHVFDISGGSSSAAMEGFLSSTQQQIANLDAQRTWVYAGTRSYESWSRTADALEQSLSSSLGEASGYSFGTYVKEAAAATAGEVGDASRAVADAATSGTTWGVAAAVLVLFVAWRLS